MKKIPSGYVVDNTPMGVIKHEFGHAMANLNKGSLEITRDVWHGLRGQEMFSKYAMYNAKELTAEAFVMWDAGLAQELTDVWGCGRLSKMFSTWKKQ